MVRGQTFGAHEIKFIVKLKAQLWRRNGRCEPLSDSKMKELNAAAVSVRFALIFFFLL